jgi:tetratricopeptide (TPR) repeat protein
MRTRQPLKNTLATLLSLLATAAAAQHHDPRALAADPATARSQIAPRLEGLGDYSREITASNADSKYFFDQGLRLTYGFNHSEALRAFKEAVRLDPKNAMAHWGWALTLGPNLNLPMQPEVMDQAYAAIQQAVALKDKVSPREQAFIDALATRYSNEPDADRAALDAAYAAAMAKLYRRHPDDLDAATLYGAALMNLSPWNYWYQDGVPYERTKTFIDLFEWVLSLDEDHPGALHYYIHAVEAQQPERAEWAADTLRGLMPSAGHMQHMPSHIYMRVGRYDDGYDVNIEASLADERYIAQCQAQGLYPVGYYPHNLHFLVWAAMLQGRSETALEHARKIQHEMPKFLKLQGDVPRSVAGDAWRIHEHFMSQTLYTLVRFGRWQEILREPAPPESARFMTGIWHYARGLAFAYTGEFEQAGQELDALAAILDERDMADYWINASLGSTLLEIAGEILDGELAGQRGDHNRAVSHLEKAVRLQDTLAYTEPPDWYFPTRHFLGAALIDAGRPAEAEAVYWADLKQNPDNAYSLFGLLKAMEAQGKTDAAAGVQTRFTKAWAKADRNLKSSRF